MEESTMEQDEVIYLETLSPPPAMESFSHRYGLSMAMVASAEKDPSDKQSFLSRDDARHIFQNKTVFFAGDASIQTLFRDLAQLVEDGTEMADTEVDKENYDYVPVRGEWNYTIGNDIKGQPDLDFRIYHLSHPYNIILYYVYISSLNSIDMINLMEWLESDIDRPTIDMFVFYSLENDLIRWKSTDPLLTFHEHFFNYTIRLDNILHRLSIVAQNVSEPFKLFWISPFMARWSKLMNGNEDNFFPVKQRCDYFAKKHQFFDFDLASIWRASTIPFVIPTNDNFSGRGIRLLTIILSEIMMETWQRPIFIIPDD